MPSSRFHPRLLALLLVATFSSAGAQETPPRLTRLPVPPAYLEALRKEDHTDYYGLYLKQHKVGWMRTTRRLGTYRDQPAYIDEMVSFQSILNGQEPFEALAVDREFFSVSPPYGFLGAHSESKQGDFENSFDVHHEDGKFKTKSTSGEDVHERDIDAMDYTFEDALTAETWCLTAPLEGDTLTARSIDWEKTAIDPQHFTLAKVLPEDSEARYRIDFASNDDANTGEFDVNGKGTLIRGTMGGAYEIVREEEETAKHLDEKIDVFQSSLTITDLPLGDPTTVTTLVLDIEGKGADKIPDGGMQRADYNKETGILRLTIQAKGYDPLPASPEEIAEASLATFAFPADDDEIRKLAARAVGKAKSDYAKVGSLVDFVDRYIIDDSMVEPPTVRDIIRVRRGDCTEHSALFVTLARAAGIPAREVSGLIYGEDTDQAFGGHAWCEVAIDGNWRPVDPTWGETMPNATHLRASSGPSGTNDLAVLLGDLKLTVVSVEHASAARSLLDFSSRLLKSLGAQE
jgi:hypothetical protein